MKPKKLIAVLLCALLLHAAPGGLPFIAGSDIPVAYADDDDAVIEAELERVVTQVLDPLDTDYEKLTAIWKYICENYDYDDNYEVNDWRGLILYGKGECWACSGLVLELCTRAGITAWLRDGSCDQYVFGQHRNVMAQTSDGKYYVIEAGFRGKAGTYRGFVRERSSLFSYKYNSAFGAYMIYQYDGLEDFAAVPEYIDGNKIEGIYYDGSGLGALKEIYIPASVEYIAEKSAGYTKSYSCKTYSYEYTLTEGFVIYCDEGSAAEEYAKANGIEYARLRIMGDVDGSGEVNRVDKMLLTRYIAGWDGYAELVDADCADLNGDGRINRIDQMILARYIAGWEGYGSYITRV